MYGKILSDKYDEGRFTMNHLVRMTKDDYRDYRRTYMSVNYSYQPRGCPIKEKLPEGVHEFYKELVFGKGEFLNMIEKSIFEFYFYKDENEKIIGYVILSFSENKCTIEHFAVLEEGKGIGTDLFQKTLEIIKAKKIKHVVLWCPFKGAQEFWKKMGFRQNSKIGKGAQNFLQKMGAVPGAGADNGFELVVKK